VKTEIRIWHFSIELFRSAAIFIPWLAEFDLSFGKTEKGGGRIELDGGDKREYR